MPSGAAAPFLLKENQMKKLLLASAAALALLTMPASAAIVQNLGVNPNSGSGHFSNDVGGATFEDDYTFQLLGAQFVTIASATNVYASALDKITGFTGQLYQIVGAVDPEGVVGDDIGFGAITAVACPTAPTTCQILGGSRELPGGNYYLEITGTGGGQAGYGGDLTTISVGEVPIPGMALAVPLGALGFGWMTRRRRKLAN